MKQQYDYHIDITLAEIAYWHLVRKRKPLTIGNLFWTMEKIVKKIDLINRGKKNKLISISNGECKFIG
jgi:hypothetical protein